MFSLSLTVPAQLEMIESICDAVDSAAAAAGFDERARYSCQLAASEACENIVKHGYGERTSGEIEARLSARCWTPARRAARIHCDQAN